MALSAATAEAASAPHLRRQGTARQLVVDDKPFLILGGELANSSASSLAYLLMNFSGGMIGLLSFAPLANRLGRRGAFAVYHVGAGLLAPLTYLGHYGYLPTLVLLSLMAFS